MDPASSSRSSLKRGHDLKSLGGEPALKKARTGAHSASSSSAADAGLVDNAWLGRKIAQIDEPLAVALLNFDADTRLIPPPIWGVVLEYGANGLADKLKKAAQKAFDSGEFLKCSSAPPPTGKELNFVYGGIMPTAQMLNFVTGVADNPKFQIDPEVYMIRWKEERGAMEEYRFPEDPTFEFIRDFLNQEKGRETNAMSLNTNEYEQLFCLADE